MLCPKPTERLFPTPQPVSKKTKSRKIPEQRTAMDWNVLTEVKFYPLFRSLMSFFETWPKA